MISGSRSVKAPAFFHHKAKAPAGRASGRERSANNANIAAVAMQRDQLLTLPELKTKRE